MLWTFSGSLAVVRDPGCDSSASQARKLHAPPSVDLLLRSANRSTTTTKSTGDARKKALTKIFLPRCHAPGPPTTPSRAHLSHTHRTPSLPKTPLSDSPEADRQSRVLAPREMQKHVLHDQAVNEEKAFRNDDLFEYAPLVQQSRETAPRHGEATLTLAVGDDVGDATLLCLDGEASGHITLGSATEGVGKVADPSGLGTRIGQ